MVRVETSEESITIGLHPNRSATWKETRTFVLLVGFIVLFIALVWAFVGAWIILPFAGLEVALLAFFMHKVSKKTYESEELQLSANALKFSGPKLQRLWPRAEVAVTVFRAEKAFDVCRIFIHDHDRRCTLETHDGCVECGVFLNQKDKQELIGLLVPRIRVKQRSSRVSSVAV